MSESNLYGQDPYGQTGQSNAAEQAAWPGETLPDHLSRPWRSGLDTDSEPRWMACLLWGWLAFSVFSVFFLTAMLVLGAWYD